MTKEVVSVRWSSTKESGQRELGSRGEAVAFVMEELESSRRHNFRLIAEGTEFGIVDIVRMYARRNLYRRSLRRPQF
jgi:hypothetical protein